MQGLAWAVEANADAAGAEDARAAALAAASEDDDRAICPRARLPFESVS